MLPKILGDFVNLLLVVFKFGFPRVDRVLETEKFGFSLRHLREKRGEIRLDPGIIAA